MLRALCLCLTDIPRTLHALLLGMTLEPCKATRSWVNNLVDTTLGCPSEIGRLTWKKLVLHLEGSADPTCGNRLHDGN